MARDYRYGHKQKPVATRRSQEGGVALDKQVSSGTTRVSRLKTAAKTKATPEPAPLPEPIAGIEPPTVAPEIPPELADEPEPMKAGKKPSKRKAKAKTTDKTDSSEEKDSPAPTPQVEPSSDSGLANVEQVDDDEPVTKKRFFWLKASGLLVLLVAVTSWLVYAPLILAFLLEMGWIDEETRLRWDSREARQPQMAFVEKVLPLTPDAAVTPTEHSTPAEAEPDPSVNFTFYDELPKAAIHLTAQPLPVKTRAPMYLQLSSFTQQKDASEERSRLTQKGYLPKVTAQVAQNGKPVYVVRMGPYEDQRDINRIKVELQKLGVDAKEVTMASVIKEQERSQEKMLEKANEKSSEKAGVGR